MRKIAISLLLLAIVPIEAKALNTYDGSDVLSYVAMPLAVSAVCDVRGVQTDRVGELVTYMDQANVAPTDFVDVFRYVPVALVMRTDGRPDFVEWVHGEVDRGVTGPDLVTAMETQLRTYDNYVPVSNYTSRRPYTREAYAYAYQPDYVPVVIRTHCERLIADPLSLLEMPVAAADVYDLGLPYDRVSGFVVELNLGGVPPLQFVELMRYAPVALGNGGYYGQPDFVQFVRTQRNSGVRGYTLVQAVDQRLRAYNVVPQIDLAGPAYGNQAYYVPPPVQNYVDPANTVYVPPVVQTRVAQTRGATNFAPGRPSFNQAAPAVGVASQVQRLLGSPSGAAVVVNPAQARRELALPNRAQQTPIATAPAIAPPIAVPGRIANRARAASTARQPAIAAPAVASAPRGNGNGQGRVARAAPPAAIAPPVALPPGRMANRSRAPAIVPQRAIAAPAVASAPRGNGNGNGQGRVARAAPPAAIAPPVAVPGKIANRVRAASTARQPAIAAPAVARAPQGNGNGRGRVAPARPANTPMMSSAPAAPAPQPAARAAAQKKKGKAQNQ